MQPIFTRGPSATIRMVVLVIASITLMTIDQRWQSLEMVRSTLSGVVYTLQYSIDLPIRFYYWADEVSSSKQTLLEKNREFEARHLENRVQLQKLDIIEKENARLRLLLSATQKSTERLLIAEIINVDVDPYRQLIVINKGNLNDVYQGQPIIDAQGIIGQIVHVSLLSSTAILITDASHAIPIQVDRTGLRANAFGTGKIDQLDLRYLPHNADVQVGDMLISSGLGGTFPPNYPVATITKVERPTGEPFATIEAMPLALLDKSREVLLVWRNIPQQTDAAIAEPNASENDPEQNNKTKAGDNDAQTEAMPTGNSDSSNNGTTIVDIEQTKPQKNITDSTATGNENVTSGGSGGDSE